LLSIFDGGGLGGAAPLRPAKVLMKDEKENPIFIAFGVERNSAMDRGDLANLTAFVAADQRSFRAAASRLDVTRPLQNPLPRTERVKVCANSPSSEVSKQRVNHCNGRTLRHRFIMVVGSGVIDKTTVVLAAADRSRSKKE
jgi:hypothetical protein